MAWQKLIVEVTPEDRESVELAAIELGALALSLEDAGDQPLLEPAPGETPLWARLRLIALFPGDVDRAAVSAALEAGAARWEELDDRDWERAWLEDFEPACFGGRLWVCPNGQIPPGAAHVVRLDPGLAFGTGRHATTALCLDWLAAADLAGRVVLDYGCGSGILGLAAAVLGARRVYALDIDDQALTATRSNAMANGVATRFRVLRPETCPPLQVDVLVANILSGPLISLAGTLAAAVKPGGAVVLSGILDDQADEVRAAYAAWFDMQTTTSREGWARLNGIRSDRVHTVS